LKAIRRIEVGGSRIPYLAACHGICGAAMRFIGIFQTFYPRSGDPVYAILIAIRSYGFEGPDFRWIAVTGKL
jgi:predicted secreted protein